MQKRFIEDKKKSCNLFLSACVVLILFLKKSARLIKVTKPLWKDNSYNKIINRYAMYNEQNYALLLHIPWYIPHSTVVTILILHSLSL